MALGCIELKNYVVTIELILAGDANLTPNQNIEIFSAVYSFIKKTPRALTNVLAYSLQSMLLFFVCFCLFETLLLLYSTVLNILFHLILLYTYFIIIVEIYLFVKFICIFTAIVSNHFLFIFL